MPFKPNPSRQHPTSRTHIFVAFLVWCCVLFAPAFAHAQMASGSITGTVTDPTGALVVGVSIKIGNRSTGASQTLTTTSSGIFNQPNLDPGNYDVTITATGFATEKTQAIVDVGHNTVLEIKLQIATDNTQVVNVESASSTVDLGSTQISQTVNGKTLRELPLNGRDWTSLSVLEPNVHTVDNQLSISAGDNSRSNRGVGSQISIGGTRPAANNYRLDGITTNDYSGAGPGGALGGTLGVDALQEFSVVTSNATPEYGRTYGGVISAVTRQGGNQFHGTLYEFIRNSAIQASPYLFPGGTPGKPPFRRNQFGGTIGGPIHKAKAFFFFNYEGLRQNRTTSTPVTLPSPNAIGGLLVCTQAAAGKPQNSACLTGKGGTVVAAGGTGVQQFTVDPNVVPYLPIFTPPSNAIISSTNPDVANYSFNAAAIAREDLYTGRADYVFSDKDNIHATALNDSGGDTQPDGFNFVVTGLDITRRTYSTQESHQFTSNALNTAHIGYAYTFSIAPAASTGINPLASNAALGFVPANNVGEIQIGGLSTFFGGVNAEGVYSWHYHSYQAGDDFYFTKGAHSIQAGFSYEKIQSNDSGNVTNGFYTFPSYQAFITNAPTSFTSNIPSNTVPTYLRQNVYGAYAMDNYHARKNLTLTYGVRYEPISSVSEKNGRIGLLLNPTDPAVTVVNHLYNNPSLLNFSPRLGFAWDPFGSSKTSIRAAYGIYDTLPLTYMFTLNTVTVAPFGTSANLTSAPVGSFGAYSTNATNPKLAYNLAIANPTNKTAYVQQNFSRPYVQQFIFNVQQELARNLSLEIGYTGSHGVRQPIKSNDGNIVNPVAGADIKNLTWPAFVPTTTNGVTTYKTSGTKLNTSSQVGAIDTETFNSSTVYNALTVALRGSGKNYHLGVAYTWSKSLDEASSSNGGTNFSNSLIAPLTSYVARFKGLSDFNIGQNVSINGLYSPRSYKTNNTFVREAVNGFQIGGIIRVASGLPFTPLISGDSLGLSSANVFNFPDRVFGPGCNGNPVDATQKLTANYLKRQCFAYPTAAAGPNGTFIPRMGNLGRNSVFGPGITTVDMSIVKNTAIPALGELARVEFRAEAFNVLNHPNFQVPARANSVIYAAAKTIGTPGAVTTLPLLTSINGNERQLQFGLKLIF